MEKGEEISSVGAGALLWDVGLGGGPQVLPSSSGAGGQAAPPQAGVWRELAVAAGKKLETKVRQESRCTCR